MKKRSAIILAAALAGVLLAGVVSVSFANAPTSATADGATARPSPRVRTVERVITIHRTASPRPGAPTTVVASSSAPASVPISDDANDDHDDDGSWDEDGFEDHDEDDDDSSGHGSGDDDDDDSSGHGSGDDDDDDDDDD